MSKVLFITVVILLLAGTVVSFDRPNNVWLDRSVSQWSAASGQWSASSRQALNTSSAGSKHGHAHRQKNIDCLPKDVQRDSVVSYGMNKRPNVTVEKKLAEMKARCRNSKLVDAHNKEIRFFRVSCWGNPPPDYQEIKQREHAELEKLKKSYTVIVMGCNPLTP